LYELTHLPFIRQIGASGFKPISGFDSQYPEKSGKKFGTFLKCDLDDCANRVLVEKPEGRRPLSRHRRR
jgi:hypothetical protein